MERTTRRFGLGTRVFASDPWTVIRRSIEQDCLPATTDAAFALIEQAEDFYRATESGVKAAKPLLLYYCFMNLAKAFTLTRRQRENVDNAHHGLKERLGAAPNNQELVHAYLDALRTPLAGPAPPANQTLKNFDELLVAITGVGIQTPTQRFDLPILLPQVVPGHRLWAEAHPGGESERFVAIEQIDFMHDEANHRIWLNLYIFADDLIRVGLGRRETLIRSRLQPSFQAVTCLRVVNDRQMVCFEQRVPITYAHRPSDEVPNVVSVVRHLLWRTVRIAPPYRSYYLYLPPVAEHPQVLPQLLSLYGITYYLGSIVRYRPHHFDRILDGNFGPFIEAFLNDQPSQFIYLMASEFAKKEVTKAAIV